MQCLFCFLEYQQKFTQKKPFAFLKFLILKDIKYQKI